MTGLTLFLGESRFLESKAVDEMSELILIDRGRHSVGLLWGSRMWTQPVDWQDGENNPSFVAVLAEQRKKVEKFDSILADADPQERELILEALDRWARSAHRLFPLD